MKHFFIFTGGLIAGILAMLLLNLPVNEVNQPNDGLIGLTIFPEKGESITRFESVEREIEVFQVLRPNMALARTGRGFYGIVVLLINHDGKAYYDQQIMRIPADKSAIQIGVYQYTTKDDMLKTVPVVIIE